MSYKTFNVGLGQRANSVARKQSKELQTRCDRYRKVSSLSRVVEGYYSTFQRVF